MNKKTILIIFLIASIQTFGQYSYYKEAVITKTDNSTLNGSVEKISESKLNPEIKFKEDAQTDDVRIIPVTEIKQIVFLEDSSVFQNVIYEHLKNSLKITENRLAKKLVNGYAQLFKLQLPDDELNSIFETNNTYVYVVLIDSNYYVLNQTEKLTGNKYKLEKNYIGVLSYLLKDYDDLRSQVWTLDFNDKQLISIIVELNERNSGVECEVLLKKEKMIVIHGPQLGYILTRKDHSNSGSGFNIGYTLNLIFPQVSEKVSTEIGINWCRLNVKEYEDYNYLRMPVGGTYRFNNNKVSPYLNAGISLHFLSNQSIDPYFSTKIGVNILQKFDINIEADFDLSATSNLPYNNTNFIYFNVGYLFSNR